MDVRKSFITVLVITPILLSLSGCGGSNGGANFTLGTGVPPAPDPGSVSLGISDAPIDDVKSVVLEIDTITFVRSGASDIEVDEFTSTDLGLSAADSFQIDLLDYQGTAQAIVIEDLELDDGEIEAIELTIIDGDINRSFVLEQDDTAKPINISGTTLSIAGFSVEGETEQTFTVEFNLRRSLVYDAAGDDYSLNPRGIRVQDNASDSRITGNVDTALFDTESPCDEKTTPTMGNVMYLYAGHDLALDDLADAFDPDVSGPTVPSGAIEPFAVETVSVDGDYSFAFLPAGDYTLVFSCDAEDDNPEDYDGLTLPMPDEQIIELTITAGAGTSCDLPIVDDSCF